MPTVTTSETTDDGRARTAAARLARRRYSALRHAQRYADALRLIGYTVIPPEDDLRPRS